MRITAGGLVGVGATSAYQDSNDRLVIAGGRLAVNALSYNAAFFNRSDAGIISEFGTGGFGRGGLGFDGTDLTLFSRSGLKIQHSTNSTAVTINTAGNVGIGTTSPSVRLHVSSSSSAQIRIEADTDNVTETDVAELLMTQDGAITTASYSLNSDNNLVIGVNSTTAPNIYFATRADGTSYASSADAKLTILNGGNVGIGTTAPAFRLDVNGTFQSGGDATFNGTNVYINSSYIYVGNNTTDLVSISGNTMYFPGDGKVGIGTTSPGARLNIAGNLGSVVGAGNSAIRMTNTDTGNYASIGAGIVGITNAGMQLSVDGTSRMVIDSVGNVGIGTSSPTLNTTGRVLHINASSNQASIVHFTNGTTGDSATDGLIVGRWSDGANYFYTYESEPLYFGAGNSVRMAITSDGNVGIGTTAPTVPLQIVNTNATISMTNSTAFAVDTGSRIFLGGKYSSATSNNTSAFAWLIGAKENATDGNQAGYLSFTTTENGGGFAERMRISSTGNVSIGTSANPGSRANIYISESGSTPNAILRLQNTGSAYQAKMIITDGNTNDAVIGYQGGYTSSTQYLGFGIGTTFTQMILTAAGNVGIGTTSPSYKLQVAGTVSILNGASDSLLGGSALYLEGGSGSNYTILQQGIGRFTIWGFNGSSWGEKFTINNTSGNVGIGTTSPGYKLDVVGDTRITSGSLGVGVAPNATDGRIDASNDIVAYQTSDQRLKENVTPIENALEKVKSLTGVEFDWIEEHKHIHGYEGHDTGIIAQQVQSVMPTAVRTNDTGYLSVRYEKLIGLLIEANKELAARVEELEKKLK
jgi:hypothetical protein